MSELAVLTRDRLSYFSNQYADQDTETAQRFWVLFGSEPDTTSGKGTAFMSMVRHGQIMTNATAVAQFAISAAEAVIQMGDQSELPLAQQIRRVDLVKCDIKSGVLTLAISLVTGGNGRKIQSTLTLS